MVGVSSKLCRVCKKNYAVYDVRKGGMITTTQALVCPIFLTIRPLRNKNLTGMNVIGKMKGIITLTLFLHGYPIMANNQHDPKAQALRQRGCLNQQPDAVTDDLFHDNKFFDRRDLVQVRYEMLRRVKKEGVAVQKAAADFGVSRPTWYQAWNAFLQGGLPALVPSRPGPRQAHKLKPDIVEVLRRARHEQPDLRIQDLVDLVNDRFGIRVHPRSIERALQRSKKNK